MPVISRIGACLRPGGAQDERGASAVIVAVMMIALLSVGALTIDYGQASVTRRATQNAADALAVGIAERCARQAMALACVRQSAENNALLNGNAPEGRISTLRTPNARTVQVGVSQEVEYALAPLLGYFTDTVVTPATAEVTTLRPTEGYPVLPLGVGYCTWKNNSALAGTANESTRKINLRTDTLQALRHVIQPVLSTVSGVLELSGVFDALGTSAADNCTDTDGRQLLNFRGAIWLTGEHVVSGLLSPAFGWEADRCRLRVGNDLSTFVGGTTGLAFLPTGCSSKFGPGKEVAVGKTILLPIYKPQSTVQNRYGFKVETCVGLGSLRTGTCLEVPPKIGVQVVGYAPFKVTGWTYPGTPSATDSSVGCSPTTLSLNPRDIANATFTILERLLGAVTSLLSGLLGLGNLNPSIACNGLQGHFTKSFTKDPNFQYGAGGEDFGAGLVRLTR